MAPTPAKKAGRLRSFFSWVIMLLLPFGFFVGLELVLRLLQYGPNLDLLVSEQIGDKTYFVMNPEVSGRYFSKVRFSPNTSLDFFRIPKPQRTLRIICLGGSTTAGFPYGQVGSFSTFLRERLQRIFPSHRVEVINFGITATNSFTVNDIAAELGPMHPDLIVVYDGHNEFYGALGAASAESSVRSRWLTKWSLRLVRFRTFHLIRSILLPVIPQQAPESEDAETLMEALARDQYVPLDSPVYADALSIFRSNLRELADIGRSLRVPIVVCTQVSNLRDLPPFVSRFSDKVMPDDRRRYDSLSSAGLRRWQEARFSEALKFFREALTFDSLRGDMHYAVATCLDTLGLPHDALRSYRHARDADQLRFRTSSDFNRAILALGSVPGVTAVDIESTLMGASPDSLIGSNLILEHLHPNLEGYFLIARAIAAAIRSHGLLGSEEDWSRADALDERALRLEHPLSPLDLRAAELRINKLVAGWPFNSPGSASSSPPVDPELEAIALDLVHARSTWEEAHVAAAEYHQQRGALAEAAREYRVLVAQFPASVSAYLRLAQVHLALRQPSAAERVLRSSLEAEETHFAYSHLGILALERNSPVEAVSMLERSLELAVTGQEQSITGYYLALAFYRNGYLSRAFDALTATLRISPEFEPARQLMKVLQDHQGATAKIP